MTYQVLARKWRPQDFASLIGQEAIVAALRHALREGRIAQAYLFSGIRGVGKTTAARLLAKALNCEKGPTDTPCNECTACREITAGGDLDVIEVDAATHSKVEQIRDLTESLRYGPARDRYKVVVLDEVHRLSRSAFDALLKIVEEPPAHVVFIFATTEIEAVPATILSRCQEFHFRRVASAELARHLREICVAESLEASDTALRLIARAGEGSVRDAVALLDQLATFGSGAVRDQDALRLVGGLDTALFHELLAAILAGRGAEVTAIIRRVEEDGGDPRHLYSRFLLYCRDAVHLALGSETTTVDLPVEEAERLQALARPAGYENLLRLLQLLLAGENVVRRSELPAVAIEVAWLRAAELPKLMRVEELLAGADPGSLRAAAPAAPKLPAAAPVTPPPPKSAPPASVPPARTTAPPASTPRPASSGDAGLEVFLTEVSKRKQALAAHLQEAHGLEIENGLLKVIVPADDDWLQSALQRASNRDILTEAARLAWGPQASWTLASDASRTAAPLRLEPVPTQEQQTIAAHPMVQSMLEIFGGKVERVERLALPQEDEPS